MMRATTTDPIIAEARRRMLRAAALYERAIAELLPALHALDRHPDTAATRRRYKARQRSRDALTLAYWYHDCCTSALEDGGDQAGAWLREDATGGAESSMRLFIETEEADLVRFAAEERSNRAAKARRVQLGPDHVVEARTSRRAIAAPAA